MCCMSGTEECKMCPQHPECYSKKKKMFSQYCKNFNTCDALKMIDTLREGYKRILQMDGGDAEAFCLQILDHSKEYEDRAIIQQQVQPENCQRICKRKECVYWVNDLCGFRGDCSRAISG